MNTVAKTIIEQLGGNRFAVMTGAKNFVAGEYDVSFRLPGAGGYCKNGINAVTIELAPDDTYTVEFSRIRGGSVTYIAKLYSVYCDQLQAVFSKETGLRTSL